MNAWIWLVVVIICIATFGLGVYAALVFGPRRPINTDRVHAAVGVVLMVVAMIVVVDIIYLQADYKKFAEAALQADKQQIACNKKTLDALMQVSHERRAVDDQARAFDLSLLAFLHAETPVTRKALEDAAVSVSDARLTMMKVYDSVDMSPCTP